MDPNFLPREVAVRPRRALNRDALGQMRSSQWLQNLEQSFAEPVYPTTVAPNWTSTPKAQASAFQQNIQRQYRNIAGSPIQYQELPTLCSRCPFARPGSLTNEVFVTPPSGSPDFQRQGLYQPIVGQEALGSIGRTPPGGRLISASRYLPQRLSQASFRDGTLADPTRASRRIRDYPFRSVHSSMGQASGEVFATPPESPFRGHYAPSARVLPGKRKRTPSPLVESSRNTQKRPSNFRASAGGTSGGNMEDTQQVFQGYIGNVHNIIRDQNEIIRSLERLEDSLEKRVAALENELQLREDKCRREMRELLERTEASTIIGINKVLNKYR